MGSFSVTRDVAEAIRDAAQSVHGVAGLTSGRMGRAVVRVPGAMIEGIELIDASHLAVHVIYDLSSRREIPQMVTDIQEAVAAVPAIAQADATPRIDVVVADAMRTRRPKQDAAAAQN